MLALSTASVASAPASQRRILLGQLISNGDCLYATAVARQIKRDFPGCHLTWAISSTCSSVIRLNPDVDDVWEIPMKPGDVPSGRFVDAWQGFRTEAERRRARGEFDEIFYTQILPDNAANYDGMIRTSLFRGYPRPITVPVMPVVRLSDAEVENVRQYAQQHRLGERSHVILFETSPKTHEALLNMASILEVAGTVLTAFPNACVILSSDVRSATGDERILDGSVLSLRENAELSKYCTLLVGCSSGITWLCTSDWAKPLPMIQLLKRESLWAPSVVRDLRYWHLATDQVVEIADCGPTAVAQCVIMTLTKGIDDARSRFHQEIAESLASYDFILRWLLFRGDFPGLLRFVARTFRRRWSEPRFLWWHLGAPFFLIPRVLRRLTRSQRTPASSPTSAVVLPTNEATVDERPNLRERGFQETSGG